MSQYYEVYKKEKNGKPIFYVAHWNEQSGHYEYPGQGTATWFGSLDYCAAQFNDLKQAQRHCRYLNTGK